MTRWIYRWRNPICNGMLPPGSMGLPLIGETIQLVIPNASLDLLPFIKKRITRYGPIFRTNIAGRPVIVSSDPEFNHFLLRHDGKLVESWSMDTFAQVFDQVNHPRKYARNLALQHFGVESLKSKLLVQMEDMVRETLSIWSTHESVEVKSQSVMMAVSFATRQIFSGDLDTTKVNFAELFRDLLGSLMSFPLNIPGTSHHKCLQTQKKVKEMIRDLVRKRVAEPDSDRQHHGDLLDHIIEDSKNTESFLNEDFIVQLMFGLLFVSSESVSTTLALAFKLIAEHTLVLEELTVINEVLRLGNIAPGILRRALKDIPVNGYTIPSGWVIVIASSALHLNADQFEDPLKFNPWRWKEIQPSVVAKCYMPFGSGMKQCAGAEYSRVLLATFLHVLVTKYRWVKVKGGKIVRSPIVRFPEGFHYKISERNN
ncbi:hypothetical protein RD792_009738 [Penstemon davidsonii]|uniref:Cytochrome P450 n=1 Tax=Penstemon davidsonii TaxID=160366 RepID=A0ABR0D177_9LAMI|nr:hypothetical protein RD792_009738 [Penstemon davidsonii]